MRFSLPGFVRRFNGLFVATVVLPTAIAAAYFGLFASDVFLSESRFVVRSPDRQTASPLGFLLKGAGFSRAQDDSYSVQDFILSRDALNALNEGDAVSKAFGSPAVDRISRFAGLDPDDSLEALYRYYTGKVKVQTDSTSSIVTLTVRAFTSLDAHKMNKVLLEQSEALVNRLNERGRQDLIRYASNEVKHAEARARDAALALSKYRNTQGIVDPERQATVQMQQIAKLQDELVATTTQLAQLRAFAPQNPQVDSLQNRAKSLETAISHETAKMTGGQRSLAGKASEFQRLALDLEFANKQLASTLASLETARSEAQRQQVYLERISQPSTPDVAQEPRRLRNIAATIVLGLMAWGILSMLMAGVKEHQD